MKDMANRNRRKNIAAVAGETHGMHKLTEDQVIEIRNKAIPRVVTYQMLADEYGVSKRTINAILCRQLWSHI